MFLKGGEGLGERLFYEIVHRCLNNVLQDLTQIYGNRSNEYGKEAFFV